MAARRATSPDPDPTDAPTVAVADGRHARGTWTPQVVPGSGGRRHLDEHHVPAAPVRAEAPEPPTVVVASVGSVDSVASVASVPPVGARRVGRAPIRYAPVPGSPRRTSLAVWGPARPVGV